MNLSPDISTQVPEPQQRRLARWLIEWNLDRALRSTGISSDARSAESLCDAPKTGPGALAVGQVRLFHPGPSPTMDQGPLYVAVLEERSGNTFLIAPFGRFSEPATPGEWKTGLRPMPLRVLCLWNARVVTVATLRSSWQAGRIQGSKIIQALELHAHVLSGAPLASSRPADLGPPLRHPLDPRHAYMAEAAALLDEHLAALESLRKGASPAFLYEQPSSQLLRAAESKTPYGRRPKRREPRR